MQTMVKSKRSTKNNKAKSREAAHRIWASAALAATPARRVIIPRPDVLHNYLEYKQINQYLEYLANRYPKFVKLYTLGLSAERREIRALDINWLSAENFESKPAQQMGQIRGPVLGKIGEQSRNIVFIEAGTHGREWISITTALNCIYQVTERYTRNIEILRKLRFIIVPVVNPDGYEYSRTKNPNWRKNRRSHKSTKFVGTDCNRNYDIFWDSGTSKMNRNTYKGERPFSEPETRAMRNLLDSLEPNLLFFLSLHSYGQSIMYPWGYTREPPHFWRELHTLATCGRTAIKSYNGREYRTGSISCLTKRTISGSVVDYVYGVLRTPMALVMELPSRDLGFQPPMENISQIGHESWFGIREMCKRAYDLRHQINRNSEPKLPRPAGADALIDGGNGERLIAAAQSISSSNATDAGGDNAEKKTKTTPKKGKRRLKRSRTAQHEAIMEIQHRSLRRPLAAATSRAGTATGAAGVAHKRLLATKSAPPLREVREGATTTSIMNTSTPPPPTSSRAGHGDGPMSVRGKNARTATAAQATTFMPLGVFL